MDENDDGYYSDPPIRVVSDPYPPPLSPTLTNNSPPVLTGLGKWHCRKPNLCTELYPTISKDNAMGEAARQTKLLAEFAKN